MLLLYNYPGNVDKVIFDGKNMKIRKYIKNEFLCSSLHGKEDQDGYRVVRVELQFREEKQGDGNCVCVGGAMEVWQMWAGVELTAMCKGLGQRTRVEVEPHCSTACKCGCNRHGGVSG